MTGIRTSFNNQAFNSLLFDLEPAMSNPTDNEGGTLMGVGDAFQLGMPNTNNGAQDGHVPVAVMVIVALAFLIASNRLGINGLSLKVKG